MTTPVVTNLAVAAAARAMLGTHTPGMNSRHCATNLARIALEAAAPEIIAAERERTREAIRRIEQTAAACQAKAIEHAVAAERERIYDLLGRDHYVIFTEDRWTVEHSVDCRLSGRMPECEYHAAVVRISGEFDPAMAGRWLITAIDPNGEPALVRDDLITAPAIPAEGTTS